MAALYDLFRTPQPKGESKVRYHARSVVTGKMDTDDLVHAIAQRSAFKEGVVTGVLVALEDALREALAEGKSVQLDGVGEKTSQKILAYRESHGGFSSVDELLEVEGIGEKKLENWKPYLTL